jgi:hypothetical protein
MRGQESVDDVLQNNGTCTKGSSIPGINEIYLGDGLDGPGSPVERTCGDF